MSSSVSALFSLINNLLKAFERLSFSVIFFLVFLFLLVWFTKFNFDRQATSVNDLYFPC